MKKILQILLFLVFSTKLFSQLDTEHWFAPMVDRTSNGNQVQRVYMSTDVVTPFKVEIYSNDDFGNNVVIGSVMIGKNSPQYFNIPTRNMIIVRPTSSNPIADLFKPVNKGLFLKGDKPFYASLRFSVAQHGEILTSKGSAALGTEFRAVMAPISANNEILNFMTSVIATENNTTVTVSGFNSNVRFTDNISRSQFTFTLNRGQSYIIDGLGNVSQNRGGAFIGAKIVADKPISITNGNFNGQYATTSVNSSDILMDQGVPIDKLGKEFVLMKGNGNTTLGMEKAIVVAVEDGTQIFVNGATTPSATRNAGEYYITENNAYLNQGSGHFNMHIKTNDKNVYVYQLLAGTDDSSNSVATGGFNYIPPLSCYLPKKIDEIGLIDENRVYINDPVYGFLNNIPTKLNIITERGAVVDVKRNGASISLTSANGPFNVTGNNGWVTYSIPNITGNVAVFSSAAVTAGISAGNYAVGYGGYFAGFSFIPAIVRKEGECVGNVILEITEGFDSYQWMKKNQTTGLYENIVGETSNTFKPLEAGYYRAKLKQGSCPEVETAEFKFLSCINYTSQSETICDTKVFTPKLTLGNQGVLGSSIVPIVNPTKGTLTVDATAKTITYTPNVGATGTDSFRYKFSGDDPVTPETEEVLININIQNLQTQDTSLSECKVNNEGIFDLTKAVVTNDTTASVEAYYKTKEGADNAIATDLITDFTAYHSQEGFAYARVKSALGCYKTATIELKLLPGIDINLSAYQFEKCDDRLVGKIEVKLNEVTEAILANHTYFTSIRYYATPAEANSGTTPGLANDWSYTANTSIYIRVESPDGCSPVVMKLDFKIGNKVALLKTVESFKFCDPDLDDSENINLETYKNLFLSPADMDITPKYYLTKADAEKDENALANGDVTLTANITYFYRFEKTGYCPNVGELGFIYSKGLASTTIKDTETICEDSTIEINAGTNHTAWQWFDETNPSHVIPSTQKVNLGPGKYYVILPSINGCDYKQNFEIIGSPKPNLDITKLDATFCDDDLDNKVVVKFSTDVTPIILENSNLFDVKYYRNAALTQLILEDEFTLTGDTSIYVRVTSDYCPAVSGKIDLKIGNKITLLKVKEIKTVCDVDYNGSESINLNNYKNLFLSVADMDIQPKFYLSLENAQKDENALLSGDVDIVNDITYYFRFEKAGLCPVVSELALDFTKGFASTSIKDTQTICEDSTIEINAGTNHTAWQWFDETDPSHVIPSTQKVNLGPGKYYVLLTSANGCDYKQSFEIIASPKVLLDISKLDPTFCDENLDGKAEVKFSTQVTPIILQNPHSDFDVKYYRDSAFTQLITTDNFTYDVDTRIYVRITTPYCPPVSGFIDLKVGNKVSLLTDKITDEVCDDDLDGKKLIQNLDSYLTSFTNDNTVTAKFFVRKADAQNPAATNNITEINVNQQQVLYVRLTNATNCPALAELTIKIKIPKKSDDLEDKIICPDATTNLDAGIGFDSYEWYSEDDPTTIIETSHEVKNLPIGKYFVILKGAYPNDCPYKQSVEIKAAELPTIESIQISGSTVKINAKGGNKPYKYAISTNGVISNYQDSDTFTNVLPGLHTAYVISADNCDPVEKEFSVIEIYNLITPNGDGVNDVLDMSLLKYKIDVKFNIYDRDGKKLFEGTTNNNYTWDGKENGKVLPTSSYWVVIEWRDFADSPPVKNSGWILLKNRNNE